MRLVAVQGCTITCKTSGVSVASFQITTPPSTTITAEDKPVYAGQLTVVATGITMGSYTCPSATVNILPLNNFATADGLVIAVEGDSGTATCVGKSSDGSTMTIVFQAEITIAGQTSVYLDDTTGDLSYIEKALSDLSTSVSALSTSLKATQTQLTNTQTELANTQTALSATQDNLNAEIANKLKAYPVGSIYIQWKNGDEYKPAVLFGGDWTQLEEGQFLMNTYLSDRVGADIPAGLPNIKGTFGNWNQFYGTRYGTGATTAKNDGTYSGFQYKGNDQRTGVTFDASKGQIYTVNGTEHYTTETGYTDKTVYGKSNTVQPYSLGVRIWKRTN